MTSTAGGSPSASSGGSVPVFSESSRSSGESSQGPVGLGRPGNEPVAADDENAKVLNELEGQLRKPDAVLEPDILWKLGEYVKNNGSPEQAIEYMTDGYVGYAQMGSLLCSWLRFVEEEEETLQNSVGQSGMRGLQASPGLSSPSNYSLKDAKKSEGENGVSISMNSLGGNGSPRNVPDESYFLRELILDRFSPNIFSGIFSSGGSGAPKWLNSLIEDADGRNLIYDLSHRYQNSLLLNFAVQKILLQPGRDEEVAAQAVALSSYFGVFHRVLTVRLKSLASTNDEEELKRLCALIQQSAQSSQLGYLHVIQVLSELASKNQVWSIRFKRLLQEVEIANKEAIGWKMGRFFAPPGDIAFTASSFIGDILSTASGGHVAPTSDVIKLNQLYAGNGDARPSVRLLHHPMLIEVLIRSLFNPGKRLQGEALGAHIDLLAASVSGFDDGSLLSEQPKMKAMRQAIADAAELGHKATEDTILNEHERSRARISMQQVCCALGIIYLLRKKLTTSEYWNSAYHVHKEPPFLVLLFHIIEEQPSMRKKVFDLVKDALQAAGCSSRGIDVASGLVSVLVSLCKSGLSELILPWAPDWARNVDSQLSRELVFGLLSIAAPPYSDFFSQQMIILMSKASIRRQSMGVKLWNKHLPLLKEFYDGCSISSLDLGKEETGFLRDLKTSIDRK